MIEPIYVSASAVSAERRCERLIGFRYVEKIRVEPGPKRQFGLTVHEHLARWLKHGIPPPDTPEGKVAKQAIRRDLLPAPSADHRVEERFEIPAPDVGEAVFFVGYKDLEYLMGDLVVVTDHKTTGSLRYAMAPEELAEDPQGLLYAADAIHRTGAPRVLGRWNYLVATNPKTGPRKPGGVRKVEHVFDRIDASFKRGLDGLVASARRIVEIRRGGIRGNDLEPSPAACGDYGGCDYREICRIDACAAANAMVATAPIELLTDCADSNMGATQQPKEENPVADNDLMKRLQEMAAATAAKQEDPAPVNPAPEMNPNAVPAPAAAQPPPSPEPAAEICDWCGKAFKRVATHKKNCPQMPAPAAAPQPPVPVPASAQPPAQEAPAPEAGGDGFVAIFDALFAKNETFANGVRRLEDVVKPLADQVARENSTNHWGTVQFAQGGPQLAAKLEAWLDHQNGAFAGVLMCDSQMAETKACREVIVRRAGVVICGVR
jgi:hypothetical protein